MEVDKKPKGYYIKRSMLIGMLIFGAFGSLVQVLTNIKYGLFPAGMAVGMALGLLMGFIIEGKKSDEGKIRELTVKEKKDQKIRIIIAGAFMFLSFLMFLVFSIFNS